MIGLSAVLLMLFSGRIAGIIGILRRALFPGATSRPLEATAFIAGLVLAPLVVRLVTGTPVTQTVSTNFVMLAIAGVLVGFGTTWGNGCTSGHGVCGLSRGSIRSLVATLTFMATGALTVFITRHIVGL